MANIKSAKKRARQEIKRHSVNQARRSAVKTAVKKVMSAIENKQSAQEIEQLFAQAQSQLARAKGKGLFHRNAIARKVSRIAARIANVQRAA
ncbi:30S ribosomal protein S20 [Candidatus Dependentiae bacterium]|nr:30S ribosomal protein S20 [Candidatus Dependentiae bacterium]